MVAQIQAFRGRSGLGLWAGAAAVVILLILAPSYFGTYQVQLLIYGLIAGRTPDDALRLGWAHGALLTTYPGDVTMAKLDEVEAFAKGGSARVQR